MLDLFFVGGTIALPGRFVRDDASRPAPHVAHNLPLADLKSFTYRTSVSTPALESLIAAIPARKGFDLLSAASDARKQRAAKGLPMFGGEDLDRYIEEMRDRRA